jgi:hypothetical protein
MKMRTRKTDPNISKRCFWYLINKYETVINVSKRLGIARETLYRWKDGDLAPSAFWLQALALDGADLHFLLTGKGKT